MVPNCPAREAFKEGDCDQVHQDDGVPVLDEGQRGLQPVNVGALLQQVNTQLPGNWPDTYSLSLR